MAFLKTLVNVGMNISNDYQVPVFKSLEKSKDSETRYYEKNRYIVIKYKTANHNNTDNKNAESKNDVIMRNVWKMMKYTQGENDKSMKMKFIMPVFVHVETSLSDDQVEIKIMVSLPPEYQNDESLQPPVPNDSEILFETEQGFECYVRTFGGSASDDDYENETSALKKILEQRQISIFPNRCICISYDPPYKLIGRRNEVILIKKE